MTDTIAVPRNTLEWLKYILEFNEVQVGDRGLRSTLIGHMASLLAQPEPVVTQTPHPWAQGMVRADVDAIPELVTRGEVQKMISEAIGENAKQSWATYMEDVRKVNELKRVVKDMIDVALIAHETRENCLAGRVARLEIEADEAAERAAETAPLFTEGPKPPNCLNWSIGEGWCVHGLKPCTEDCATRVAREVKG